MWLLPENDLFSFLSLPLFLCLSLSCLLCFSILGMHLFGCKFTLRLENGDTVSDRKNFDSLLWAIVTVFQVRKMFANCLIVTCMLCFGCVFTLFPVLLCLSSVSSVVSLVVN